MALYLVTGGAGFIGSHLVAALLERGDRVRVLDDLSSGSLGNLPSESSHRGALEIHHGDVLDFPLVRRATKGVHGVFHEAAQVSVPASVADPEKSFRINVLGTLAVLEAARAEGAGRIVFAASSAAYGDDPILPKVESMAPSPQSPYAAGKLAGEGLLSAWGRAFGMSTVALRYFNVYGPRQSDSSPYSGVVALFAQAVLAGRAPTIFGDGEQTRDFVYVEDVVRANLLAMEKALDPGEVLNVGTGRSVTVNELYRRLAELSGFREAPRYAPGRAGDVPHSRASIARASSLLGFEPSISLEDGLERTLDWYRSRG